MKIHGVTTTFKKMSRTLKGKHIRNDKNKMTDLNEIFSYLKLYNTQQNVADILLLMLVLLSSYTLYY